MPDPAPIENTLAYMDQASFLWVRASGHVHAIHCVWVYQREIDLEKLKILCDNLNHGLLGRRIERSPLPGGRHRWVTWRNPSGVHVAPARVRAELAGWLEERGQLPIDPEFGPCWHLAVLPIEDYGAAVSLVASHTVADGLGVCMAVADAAKGIRRDFGYPPGGSRTRRKAWTEDVRQFARNLPHLGRAVVGTAKVARQERVDMRGRSAPSAPTSNRPVTIPTATFFVDLADWDARADDLGGTPNTLFAGFAAKLAEKLGRLRPVDRRVTLNYPINDRTDDDLRANALKGIDFTVDPRSVTADLREVRGDLKRARASGLQKFEEQEAVLPLNILLPLALARKLSSVVNINADLPVGCSYFGDIDPAVALVDGTEADYVSVRLVEQNLTEDSMELVNGELYLSAGRICGKFFVAVRAYQHGAGSETQLHEQISQTLADFGLTGTIE